MIHFIEELVPNTWRDLKVIKDYIDITDEKILDIGCGTGFLSDKMAEKSGQVTGIDISEVNIKLANKIKNKDNVDFIVMDAFSMDFENNSFDLIIAANVLEHLDFLGLCVLNIEKLLKPGGLFVAIISTKPKWIHPITSYIINKVDNAYTDNHPQVHKTQYLSVKDIHKNLDIIYIKKYNGIINNFIAYFLMITERIVRRLTGFKPDNIGDHYDNPVKKHYMKWILPILKPLAEWDLLPIIKTKEMIIFRRKNGKKKI